MKTITNFWNYFQQNNFVFLLLNEIPKYELTIHFDKLIDILHQYNKDLDLIIKNKTKGAVPRGQGQLLTDSADASSSPAASAPAAK